MKSHVNEWLLTHVKNIEEIVDSLGVERYSSVDVVSETVACLSAENGPPATKEIARIMKPPAPPVGTVLAGYNPILDQPRPANIEDYLR